MASCEQSPVVISPASSEMGTPIDSIHCVFLKMAAGALAFVCGTETVDVPPCCSQRSALIADLLQQDQDDVDLPLPLAMSEAKAWLACAQSGGTGLERDCRHSDQDGLLIQALKVRLTVRAYMLNAPAAACVPVQGVRAGCGFSPRLKHRGRPLAVPATRDRWALRPCGDAALRGGHCEGSPGVPCCVLCVFLPPSPASQSPAHA